jgi:hypothetical protein
MNYLKKKYNDNSHNKIEVIKITAKTRNEILLEIT